MGSRIDPKCHIGEVHGIYTIVDITGDKDKSGHWIYKCVCNVCGYEKYSHYGAISGQSNNATECKHLRSNGEFITYDHKWSNRRIAKIFNHMVSRCYNKDDKDYCWYGEKGIKIDQTWLNNPKYFEEWALNNGYEDNLTIDRIDADKDYCPTNCRWIPLEENSRRAGKVNWVTVNGETLTGKQWAEKLGLGINAINNFIRNTNIDQTKLLIEKMLKESPKTKTRKPNETWFSAYGIQV